MPISGARLRKLRKKAGLSRQELADKINASVRSVYRWENDEAVILPVFETQILDVLEPGSKTVAAPSETPA